MDLLNHIKTIYKKHGIKYTSIFENDKEKITVLNHLELLDNDELREFYKEHENDFVFTGAMRPLADGGVETTMSVTLKVDKSSLDGTNSDRNSIGKVVSPAIVNPMLPAVIDYLASIGFEWKKMPFYNSVGKIGTAQYRNFLDKMPSYAKFIKSQMGGNYGASDLYVCVDENTVKRFQYYGDTSADIRTIGEYKSIDELSKLIATVV